MSVQQTPSLRSILTRFRARIAVTFGLLTIENIIEVLTPLLVGLSIDGLLNGSQTELWWLAAVLVLGTVIGTGRRFYDTRVYTDIHVQLTSETMEKGWREGLPLSTLNTRSELLREMVDFFEEDMPLSYSAVIKIVGAFVLLWFYEPLLNLIVIAAALLIVLIYVISSGRFFRLNKGLNDQWETQVRILERRNSTQTRSHFRAMARWKIRLSDLEAINYGGIAIILIAMILGALAIITSSGIATAGAVFAVLVYVLDISEGAWLLPSVFQQFIRLKEISTRLAGDAKNGAEKTPSPVST